MAIPINGNRDELLKRSTLCGVQTSGVDLLFRLALFAMPTGTRLRVTGHLMTSKRGLVIEIDDGGVYALDADQDANELIGNRVTIEGIRSGFDRLDVEWIGRADATAGITQPFA